MTLRKASDHFLRGPHHVNPIWKHIQNHFTSAVLAEVGDSGFDWNMYVTERMVSDGISEQEVVHHLETRDTRPLLVVGHAGVGKTTFLRRAIKEYASDNDRSASICWIDVSVVSDGKSTESLFQSVQNELGSQLTRLTSSPERIDEWLRFLLCANDPRGIAPAIRRLSLGVDKDVPIQSVPISSVVTLLGELSFLQLARLRFAFIRKFVLRAPVVVFDNVDLLPLRFQRQIYEFAQVLSRGSTGGEVLDGEVSTDRASVILALRPDTVNELEARIAHFRVGFVRPPALRSLLKLRSKHFFDIWGGRIAKGTTLSLGDVGGKSVDLRDLQGTNTTERVEPNDLARRAIELLIEHVTSAELFPDLTEQIYTMTRFNVRLALLAVTQYAMSGHHEWRVLLSEQSTQDELRRALSRRKMWRALYLGKYATFSTSGSWVVNLFNDGHADEFGVLAIPRILQFVLCGATTLAYIREAFGRLFEASTSRIDDTLQKLLDNSLIEDDGEGAIVITEAGQVYHRLTGEFEYLQHVVTDCYVPSRYLVECNDANENIVIRLHRTLNFASWVRDIELADFKRVLRNSEQELYVKYFGDVTISESLANTLSRCAEFVLKEWSLDAKRLERLNQLVEKAQALEKDCKFSAIRLEASQPAPLTLSDPSYVLALRNDSHSAE